MPTGENVWGGLGNKFTPLISFHTIVDEDIGALKDIILNYKNSEVFDLSKISSKKYINLVGDLYKRKYNNPLYYILRDDKYKSFVDECYNELINQNEDEVLEYAVTTDMYELVKQFIKSDDIIPSILYYTDSQLEILESDSNLSKINHVKYDDLFLSKNGLDQFGQFYFKLIEESEKFLNSMGKVFYFSSTGRNLNETNDDLKTDSKFVKNIYKNGGRISIFDMYKTEIIGGYNV